MAQVTFTMKGNFNKLNNWFEKSLEVINLGKLDSYGRMGVRALEQYTPKDTGLTSQSWSYEIVRDQKNSIISISFNNSNLNNGIPIAILIQYGHSTRSGTWVEGVDYINPALRPIFEEIADELWEEVIKYG